MLGRLFAGCWTCCSIVRHHPLAGFVEGIGDALEEEHLENVVLMTPAGSETSGRNSRLTRRLLLWGDQRWGLEGV